MYAFAVVSVALLAGQAAATAVVGRAALTARSRSALAGLLSRQTTGFDPSDIPAQCQSDCSTVVSALNTCATDVSCLCSASTNRGLYTCLECVLAIEPDASLLQQGQSSLEDYQSSCQQAGVSVTPLTLTLPSGASATGSGAGSVSSRPSATFNTGNSGVTATGTAGASTPTETDDDDDDDDSSDPLSGSGGATRNGAAFVSVSSVAVAGVVGAAMAVLAL